MQKSLNKIYDLCYISYRFITNNRKALLATILGLIIATAIMTTSLMLVESYNTKLIEELLFSSERNDFSGEIQIELYPSVESGEFQWIQNHENFTRLVTESFQEAEYQDYFIKQRWYAEFALGFHPEVQTGDPWFSWDFYDFYLKAIEADILSDIESYLNPGGRLPENYTEIILVRTDNNTQLVTGQNYTLGINPSAAIWVKDSTINVTIVGILEYENIADLLLEHLFLDYSYEYLFMLTSLENALDLMEEIMSDQPYIFVSTVHGKIFIDQSIIDINDLSKEKIKLTALFTKMNDNFVTLQNSSLSIDIDDVYDLRLKFDEAIEDVRLLQILLYLIDIPIVAIAIYLVGYSYSLIKRQKRETIGILKTRGGSWKQIITFLIGESIAVIGVTLICGYILGYFVAGTIIRSVNFLDFSGEAIPVVASPYLVQNLFFFVVVITIILNVSAMIQYTRMSIQESIVIVADLPPFWKRYYLDILATLLGLAGYFMINEIGTVIQSSTSFIPLLPIIFLLVGVPTPFLLFFGSILLIARLFPILIRNLARFLWRTRGKLGAFALRNVVQHRESASQAVILITLAISYTIISASLAVSVDETKKMGFYHYIGADLKINTVGEYSNESLLLALENIPGIEGVSKTFYAHSPSETEAQYYIFCFVDPQSFAEVAFFDEERFGISSPLPTLMELISDNQSIILLKESLDEQPNLEINDDFGFHFYNESLFYAGDSDYRNYSIIGTFNLWPQLQELEWAPSDAIFAIGSLGMFNNLNMNEYLAIHDTSLLCKMEPSADTEYVYTTAKYLSIATPHTYSAKLQYEVYLRSAERHFILAVLNSALLACIVVSVLGSMMFSIFTYLERGKEIGVERALGMTRIQTAFLFTIEGLTILFFGTVIGLAVGLSITTIFLLVIKMGITVPPIVVVYPFDFILNFLALVILIAVIGTFIIAYKSTKKDISRVLKVE